MQHHKRRRTTRAVALLLTPALFLAACGGDDDDDASGEDEAAAQEGGEVTIQIMPNGPNPVPDFEELVAPFEDETGIDVNVEEAGWDVQFDQISNQATTGEGPDITQAGTTQVPFFANLGGFVDLSDLAGETESNYPDGVWNTTQLAGQDGVWAVPWFTEARAIYYRTDVLDAAGLDPETAFSDWGTFRETLQTIKDEVPEIDGQEIWPFGQPGGLAFDLVHHVFPLIWSYGGAELNEDNTESTVASDEAVDAVTYFGQLLQDGLWDPATLELDGTQTENQFKNGTLAIWIGGPWTLASVPREDDENWVDAARNNVGIAPLPSGPSGDAFTFVGGSNLMMFESSDNQEEAWQLLEYLSQDDVQLQYAEILGFFPSTTSAQEERASADENQAAFFEAIQQGRTYAPIAQWGAIENTYKTHFGTILDSAAAGDFSADAVRSELEAAATEANDLLAQGE
ncbi:MAG: extracellular solute-binding protein [Acidimicrobiales bacterium]